MIWVAKSSYFLHYLICRNICSNVFHVCEPHWCTERILLHFVSHAAVFGSDSLGTLSSSSGYLIFFCPMLTRMGTGALIPSCFHSPHSNLSFFFFLVSFITDFKPVFQLSEHLSAPEDHAVQRRPSPCGGDLCLDVVWDLSPRNPRRHDGLFSWLTHLLRQSLCTIFWGCWEIQWLVRLLSNFKKLTLHSTGRKRVLSAIKLQSPKERPSWRIIGAFKCG